MSLRSYHSIQNKKNQFLSSTLNPTINYLRPCIHKVFKNIQLEARRFTTVNFPQGPANSNLPRPSGIWKLRAVPRFTVWQEGTLKAVWEKRMESFPDRGWYRILLWALTLMTVGASEAFVAFTGEFSSCLALAFPVRTTDIWRNVTNPFRSAVRSHCHGTAVNYCRQR